MVDPNRKINRLTAEDIAFLDECEELFGNRFSEMDDEFMEHCEKVKVEPPVVLNFSGGERGAGGQGYNNSYRGRYNDNTHNYRGGRGGGHRSYNRNDDGYNRRGGDRRHRHNYRPYSNFNERNENRAMNVRREYGKFVAASNNEHSTSYESRRNGDADNS